MTRWTDSDALNGREAQVVGGPSDGLRILVNDRAGQLRYPAAFDATDYAFSREQWQFLYQRCGCDATVSCPACV